MKIFNAIKEIRQGRLPNVKYMFKKTWDYAGKYSKEYGISRVYLFVDYFVCALLYGCAGDDYFPYKFFLLNRKGKKRFVTYLYRERFEKKHTNAEQTAIEADKEKTLHHFADYMKREWCGIKYRNTEEEYNAFYEKHDTCIIKPLGGQGGTGVEKVTLKDKFESGAQLREYCHKNYLLVEEVIPQHEAINKLHPNSVNTIRMITLKGKCIGAGIRMGVGEACVDNAHAGGIYAEVDVAEGVIVSKALSDRNSDQYICHPTTGTVIPGTRIPFWKECVAVTEEASRLMPDVYLIGFDVAVTPDGPTFVEINTNPGLGLVQASNGHGLKHEFEKIKD